MPLITVEGLDGAGKSTVIESLSSLISNPLILREPGGTDFGEAIRSVLKGEDFVPSAFSLSPNGEEFLSFLKDTSIGPWAEAFVLGEIKEIDIGPEEEVLLFNWARAEIVDLEIKPALDRERVVILDRFFDSTLAYQGFGRGLDISWIEDVISKATSGIIPDLTLYIRIDPKTRHERMAQRQGQDRIEQSGDDFFSRVCSGFDKLSLDPRFVTIDGEKNREKVARASRVAVEESGLIPGKN